MDAPQALRALIAYEFDPSERILRLDVSPAFLDAIAHDELFARDARGFSFAGITTVSHPALIHSGFDAVAWMASPTMAFWETEPERVFVLSLSPEMLHAVSAFNQGTSPGARPDPPVLKPCKPLMGFGNFVIPCKK